MRAQPFTWYGDNRTSYVRQGAKLLLKEWHSLPVCTKDRSLQLTGGDTSTAKFFINCLAETPESVAKFLVPRVRQVASQQTSPGSAKSTYIKFLTKPKAYGQILSRALLNSRKNRFLEE